MGGHILTQTPRLSCLHGELSFSMLLEAMRPTPAQLRALARRDPVLGAARRKVPPFPDYPAAGPREVRTHFDALARSIVHQQLSTRAAETIWQRVSRLTPGPGLGAAPRFLELCKQNLRGAGLSRAKTEALQDLAARVADGRLSLRGLHHRSDLEVQEALVEVRGIGAWTAQMFLLFRLGRLDVMAPGDMGLQEGLRRLDGLKERPGPKELSARTETWSPLRSVGAWVLWRLLDQA
ncbi:MAG TPA: DNA-3-methyladenine glycosylase 2 family protein [Planctomycetes bacterium]|nr:DNA-3-methyladenine glycosylase 2 family protein [Planctomycetota bacterium]HIL53088.1 DNA-3-methyladenine glycosylase 2 family protein [Planctomycetota bacterium]